MIIQDTSTILNICNGERKVTIINDVEYPWRPSMMGQSITVINSKVFIDGYELKNGKWKRSIMALWHLIF